MKTKDFFNLAVRLLGLVFLYFTLQAIPPAAALFIEAFPHSSEPGAHGAMHFRLLFSALLMVGWPLVVTLWLVRGAPPIMRIAYPESAVCDQSARAAIGEREDA